VRGRGSFHACCASVDVMPPGDQYFSDIRRLLMQPPRERSSLYFLYAAAADAAADRWEFVPEWPMSRARFARRAAVFDP
jgi:hypothetical protein